MKVVLDEGVPRQVVHVLQEHDVTLYLMRVGRRQRTERCLD